MVLIFLHILYTYSHSWFNIDEPIGCGDRPDRCFECCYDYPERECQSPTCVEQNLLVIGCSKFIIEQSASCSCMA